MEKYLEITLDDENKSKFYIEACAMPENEADNDMLKIGNDSDSYLKKGTDFLGNAFEIVSSFSKTIMNKLTTSKGELSEIEVEFSVGFNAKGNIVFASSETNLGMKLKLKWKKPDEKQI